ncbi:MAG: cobalamin biosynthesis protein [Spirochaetes bacterium]|nr:cobalamin biosynthesis protein [Spirochaetota bacterium]
MIVGREVSKLDSTGCCRAAIESVAESSIDGAAAPLFWAAVLGPWGAFLYRAINTMDSLFGHKNERYRWFGFTAAKMDDFFNVIPARLSSLLAILLAPAVCGSSTKGLRIFKKERLHHASPNAGHPEAAYAGILGIRLGGPIRYAEGPLEKPWFNAAGNACEPADITRSVRLMFVQTGCSALLFLLLRLGLPI